jgi:hypothetical protein
MFGGMTGSGNPPPASPPPSTTTPRSWAERSRVLRCVIAVVFVAGALAYFLFADPRVCTDRLVGDTTETVEVCERPSAGDPALVAAAVLLLLLLAPDLTEASVVGLISVKRQVAETRAAVADAAVEQAETRALVSNIRAEIVQNQNLQSRQEQTVAVNIGGRDMLQALSRYAATPLERGGTGKGSEITSADAEQVFGEDVASWRTAIATRTFDALPDLFTPPWGDGAVLALVRSEGGWERVFATGAVDASTAELHLVSCGLLDRVASEGVPAAEPSAALPVAAAPALNAAGRAVATLGIVLPEGTAASDDVLLGAELERAAGILGRVMIDVLGLDTDTP